MLCTWFLFLYNLHAIYFDLFISCLVLCLLFLFFFSQKIAESPASPGSPGASSTGGDNVGYRLHSNPSQVMQDRRLPRLPSYQGYRERKQVFFSFLHTLYRFSLYLFTVLFIGSLTRCRNVNRPKFRTRWLQQSIIYLQ